MKRLLMVLLSVAVLFGSSVAVCADEDQLQPIIEEEDYALYNVLDSSYRIPYESGTVKFLELGILEGKSGAYLDYDIFLVFDISDLSEDEKQWLPDDFEDGNVQISFFVTDSSGSLLNTEYVNSETTTTEDGKTPIFLILYSLNKQKHSIDGYDAGFNISISNGAKETTYNYFLKADVLTGEE